MNILQVVSLILGIVVIVSFLLAIVGMFTSNDSYIPNPDSEEEKRYREGDYD